MIVDKLILWAASYGIPPIITISAGILILASPFLLLSGFASHPSFRQAMRKTICKLPLIGSFLEYLLVPAYKFVSQGIEPIKQAFYTYDVEMLQLLLDESGVDHEIKYKQLHSIFKNYDEIYEYKDCLNAILKANGFPNHKKVELFSTIIMECVKRQSETLSLILSSNHLSGTDKFNLLKPQEINNQDVHYLALAIEKRAIASIVTILALQEQLTSGQWSAILNAPNSDGYTPIVLAIRCSLSSDIIQALKDKGAKEPTNINQILKPQTILNVYQVRYKLLSPPSGLVADEIKTYHPNIDNSNEGIPQKFICPINLEIMREPVIVSDCGGIYRFERAAIQKWLRNNKTNPVSGSTLVNKCLVLDENFQKQILNFLKQNRRVETENNPDDNTTNVEAHLDENCDDTAYFINRLFFR